jgi:hypothetical protein
MDEQEIEEGVREEIKKDHHRDTVHGEYHPSTVTGCPLKGFLDRMMDVSATPNSWMFQGSAVHYYMQETGMLNKALHNAGYHIMDTAHEVSTAYEMPNGAVITGTCDTICRDEEGNVVIIDLKYSSLKPEYGHGRIAKYFSQSNTYAFMFGADEHGLLIINSKSQNLLEDISVMSGEPVEDNWEKVKKKVRQIHSAAEEWEYDEGNRWRYEDVNQFSDDEWRDVMDDFDKGDCPSYDEECNYCDHSDYCPIKNGKLGGLNSFKTGD